jgi:hypothetical protein
MMTGINYPVVQAEGKEYTLRFSMLAEYLLSMQGISLERLLPKEHPGRFVQRMQLFAAAVAENFPDPLKAPGAIKWTNKITRSEWAAIDAAMDDALGKVEAEWKDARAAAHPPSAALEMVG